MPLAPRIYTTADPAATVRAIANIANHPFSPARGELCVSFDGYTYYTVFLSLRQGGRNHYHGTITQPTVDIDGREVSFANGQLTYDDRTYVLDEIAAIGEIITKPVMDVFSIVETHAGHYVVAQNKLTGRSRDYLDGRPLTMIKGIRVRGDNDDDLVADYQYEGHRFVVRGDHVDVEYQTATFDDQPATQLTVSDYTVTFADDLSSVTVTQK